MPMPRRQKDPRPPGRPTLGKTHLELLAALLVLPLACYASRSWGADALTNITHQKFQKRENSCDHYVGNYVSTVKDVKSAVPLKGMLTIALDQHKCVFTSNGIPNHHFNDGSKDFPNQVKQVTEVYEIPIEPKKAAAPTKLSTDYDNGIMLNGVKLDLLSAACFCVGNEPLGHEKIGCLSMQWGWRYDPMFQDPLFPENAFGADTHNAHAQPDGAYHYHGSPHGLFDEKPNAESPVIGFAADGFPIYGPYINDNGKIREVRSGYTLKKGKRQHRDDEACFPGGEYDGRFVEDWEWKPGTGDLDECNGMTRNGQYGYYVTDTYPWVMGCFRGIPDGSFKKKAAEEHAH